LNLWLNKTKSQRARNKSPKRKKTVGEVPKAQKKKKARRRARKGGQRRKKCRQGTD